MRNIIFYKLYYISQQTIRSFETMIRFVLLSLTLLLLLLSPGGETQEAKIKVQCKNWKQSKTLWQTCQMFISTTGKYSNKTLQSEFWKFVKSKDLSESCFDLHFFPNPQVKLQLDRELIEYSITNVRGTDTSLIEINCSRTSYNVFEVVLQPSTKWCFVQPVPSSAKCSIEDLEINISFSKDNLANTYKVDQSVNDKGEEQCQAEQILGIKYKFYAAVEQCDEMKKMQSPLKKIGFLKSPR